MEGGIEVGVRGRGVIHGGLKAHPVQHAISPSHITKKRVSNFTKHPRQFQEDGIINLNRKESGKTVTLGHHRQQNCYSPQVFLGEVMMEYSYSCGSAQNQFMLQLQHWVEFPENS